MLMFIPMLRPGMEDMGARGDFGPLLLDVECEG